MTEVRTLAPNVSPCTGVCRMDAASGLCLGCARSAEEIALWREAAPAFRAAVWADLPARFVRLGLTCRRLPWTTGDIRRFVQASLSGAAGTWVVGVVGAVAEFAAPPGAAIAVREDGADLVATTPGGALRLRLDDHVRALRFDPPDTPPGRQRLVLAVLREAGRLPAFAVVADLGPDAAAIAPQDRDHRLYDLGLGRKEARFCVRVAPGPAARALAAAVGQPLAAALPQLGPALLAESPARVVESALGRIEVTTPIPPPGGTSPAGPHTHLLPDHLASGRAMPAGMDLPRAYLPGAIFHPAG
ncbi:DUF1289 domain-containing protein [Rhodobacter calidifons]|uniref:DUF1289 domain-containing protein n=1 Tax=Rhodobacter calidifons TaxID=2715277 RepID=A0ABX0GB57_9RHOB|nr:DUF1289 domain-containing protein [Rhodobacter calidifons]NHB78560.1 DUF1289 domain-containing protein [Rhodobacter calidifons]